MSEHTNEKVLARGEGEIDLLSDGAPRVPRFAAHPLVWGLIGATVGSIAVYGIAQMTPPRKPVVFQVPPKSSVIEQSQVQSPEAPPTNSAPPKSDTAPVQPFGDSGFKGGITPILPNGMPSTGISGSINPMRTPDASMKLPDIDRSGRMADTLSDPPAKDASLVSVVHATEDADKSRAALASRAKKLGGSSRALPKTKAGDSLGGLIVYVPAAKAKQMIDYGSEVGAVVAKTSWSGESTKRQAKLEEDAQSYLFELQKRKQELLVRYYEDAPALVELNEEIAKVESGLKELRAEKSSDAMAVIRFEFVSRG